MKKAKLADPLVVRRKLSELNTQRGLKMAMSFPSERAMADWLEREDNRSIDAYVDHALLTVFFSRS